MIFKTPLGYFAQRFGGKWPLTVAVSGSCVISLLFPSVADYVYLLIILRMILGIFQAGCFPSSYDIILKWIPLNRRSLCYSFFEVGPALAEIVNFATTGIIAEKYGWPALFYIPGGVCGVIAITDVLLLRSRPTKVKAIEEEQSEDTPSKSLPIPWKRILTSPPVIVMFFFRFALQFYGSAVNSKIPVYLKEVQHQDLSNNGYIHALMAGVAGVSHVTNGYLSDLIINRKWLNRTTTRKMFAILTGVGMSLSLALIPASNSLTMAQVLLLTKSLSEGFGGNLISLSSEMSHNFAAVTFSLMAMIAASSGFIAPALAGFILDFFAEDVSVGWCITFFSTAILMMAATILLVIYGSAERQPFDEVREEEMYG